MGDDPAAIALEGGVGTQTVRLEDLCGFLSVDEPGALEEFGLTPADVFRSRYPVRDAFVNGAVPWVQEQLSRHAVGQKLSFPKYAEATEVHAYVLAAEFHWGSPSSLSFRGGRLCRVSGPIRTIRAVILPLRRSHKFYFRVGRPGAKESVADPQSTVGVVTVYPAKGVKGLRLPDGLQEPVLVRASFGDDHSGLDRWVDVYLLFVAGHHDPTGVRSMWTELCLTEE